MIDRCEWCKTNSGRTNANRECCEIRRLAQAPRHVLAEYAKTLSEDEKSVLRLKIKSERERIKALK